VSSVAAEQSVVRVRCQKEPFTYIIYQNVKKNFKKLLAFCRP